MKLTNGFLRDLDWAIGDVIDKHFDDICPYDTDNGYVLHTIMAEGAIVAASKYIKNKKQYQLPRYDKVFFDGIKALNRM